MEYSDVDWDPPPSDNGIPGIILDYNINNQLRHDQEKRQKSKASAATDVRREPGAWRLRADWQASYDHRDDETRTPPSTIRAGAATTPIAHPTNAFK